MNVRSLLAQTHLFVALSEPALDLLAAGTCVRHVASGDVLLEIGAASEHLYIVAVGRLRVTLEDGTVVNDVGRLEPVGEISLLSGEPRSARVHAVRDTTVLQIDRMALYQVFTQHPSALLNMSRMIITRMRQSQRAVALAAVRGARSFALLPATPDVEIDAFSHALAQALTLAGRVRRLDAATVDAALGAGTAHSARGDGEVQERLSEWLQAEELAHRHLLYVGGAQVDHWTLRCGRQADRILVLADATQAPQPSAALDALRQRAAQAPVDLLLLRGDTAPGGRVLEWRHAVGASAHYFVRPGVARDLERVARSLTGRALGLVLGGGGARGFAHIGLIRALEDSGMQVDVLGGSSMGAFVAALAACGHDSRQIQALARDSFVRTNLLNDYLFPSVSLIRGRKFLRRLQELFGDVQIEDLRTPYFCVSTNLTRGRAQVHDSGPLATWLGTSMCIPGVAPPVAYRGDLLVDGAVANSLPTDVMQGLGRGPIIASDVSTEGSVGAPGIEGPDPEALLRWAQGDKRPSLFSILFRTATLTSESGTAARAARADLYLRMPVNGIGVFDWKRIDDTVERGYRHALEHLPRLQEAMRAASD